jgi:hypothetical protein
MNLAGFEQLEEEEEGGINTRIAMEHTGTQPPPNLTLPTPSRAVHYLYPNVIMAVYL